MQFKIFIILKIKKISFNKFLSCYFQTENILFIPKIKQHFKEVISSILTFQKSKSLIHINSSTNLFKEKTI